MELDQPTGLDYAGWSGGAAIQARTQQLADEVAGGDAPAAITAAMDEATRIASSPVTMTVTSPPMATTTTTATVVPTVQEEINRIEGLVTTTENKQLDEEAAMKTFRAQQLDKVEELKDKNARLKRRSVSLSPLAIVLRRKRCALRPVSVFGVASLNMLASPVCKGFLSLLTGWPLADTRGCDENSSA